MTVGSELKPMVSLMICTSSWVVSIKFDEIAFSAREKSCGKRKGWKNCKLNLELVILFIN